MAELRRAVHHLGLRGVFLCSHLDGVNLDDPGLESFYAAVADLQVPLVLHPTVPTWGGHVKDHAMIPMAAFMVDTSFAMLRLILGGVMERHPTLQVVHPHVGGVLPYLMGRVQEQTEVKRRGRDHISQPPISYYERVWLDLVTPSAQAMRYALEFAGPERLMFGSDHPWVSIETIQDYMREGLALPEDQMAAIRGGNAASLFGLEMPQAKTSLPNDNSGMFLKLIWLLLAGGAGTLARFGTVVLAQRLWPLHWSVGTAVANVLGCLLAGMAFGWLQNQDVANDDVRLVVLVGFCGSYTTFSALVLEAGQLQQEFGWLSALGLLGLHLVLGGLGVGSSLGRHGALGLTLSSLHFHHLPCGLSARNAFSSCGPRRMATRVRASAIKPVSNVEMPRTAPVKPNEGRSRTDTTIAAMRVMTLGVTISVRRSTKVTPCIHERTATMGEYAAKIIRGAMQSDASSGSRPIQSSRIVCRSGVQNRVMEMSRETNPARALKLRMARPCGSRC